jgi:hypothetical protein
MLEFISGLLIDFSLIGGIILFGLSFSKKYRKHKAKMLVASLILIAVGFIFLDYSALSEAYQSGLESGRSI